MEDNVKKIGEIKFKDISVNVYYNKHTNKDNPQCGWQMRNPNSVYKGIMYMNNETGKITYPENAVIPEQTDRDREMLPKFIVSGEENITDAFIDKTCEYLEENYKIRNNK